MALTLDMGGRVGDALAIVQWLVEHHQPATIFMTGQMAETTVTEAGRQVLELAATHRDLFVVGNHSDTHPDFRTLTAAQISTQLRDAESAIGRTYPYTLRPWFRPPYGGVDARVLAAVGAAGYGRTITWDIDTIDWRPFSQGGPTAAQIVAKVAANVRGGSIVLMHLGGYETLDALPGVVAAIEAAGLRPVTLPVLLGGG
jgi:peptidoglycan-N-acetylglucosamine deacetylase